ncbi:Hypothetical protein D9617_7g029370 [Elsinoe fawcettii]|nr:Hypothetical protein D9617_7g029370 [Elsinoe fawcettii]
MPEDTPLTDDYVAALLIEEAKAVSSRTSAGFGVGTSKRPANTAKPNTRFLRNILRDTDTHNAALLAREEEESKARLKALEPKRKRSEQQVYSVRARREGGESLKRRKVEVEEDYGDDEPRESRDRKDRDRRRDRRSERDDSEYGRPRRGARDDGKRTQEEGDYVQVRKGYRRDEEERKDRHKHRHESTSNQEKKLSKEKSRRGTRSRSPELSRETSSRRKSRTKPSVQTKERHDSHRDKYRRYRSSSPDSESSMGPQPASPPPLSRSRGRGVSTPTRSIDKHFKSDYDPTTDVRPDEDADDWDQALEVMKDRQKWKQNGAERLKAAGFSEAEVNKWKGGTAEAMTGFRWAKKGESREWDKGKTILSDDSV